MKIHLATHFGLCFGVRDAIAQAEQLSDYGPLTVLGELVHNPVVRDRLRERGVHEGALADAGSAVSKQVLITAHGASDEATERWRSAGYAVADGTCPLVRHAHETLRTLVNRGCLPVVIGQRGHAEVEGLIGDFPGACIYSTEEDLPAIPAAERYGVIAQTTQPAERVLTLVAALRKERPESEVHFRDTVCRPTKDRQNALSELLATCDAVVVVGGRNSNNTRQLVATASARGLRVLHIERAEELSPAWFHGVRDLGLTGGTSTLKETVAAVQSRLELIAAELTNDATYLAGAGATGACGFGSGKGGLVNAPGAALLRFDGTSA